MLRFTSHSIRVRAIVLLDEAGMNANFIKPRLRWMGDSHRSYLRDTAVLQKKHFSALESSSNDFINLFGENRTMLPDIVPVDDAMEPYSGPGPINVVWIPSSYPHVRTDCDHPISP